MGALYRKELSSLAPWFLLVATLELGAHVSSLLVTPPDEMVWAQATPIFSATEAMGRSFMLLVSSLVFAYAGLAREYDDRTLQFLLSLPVSRTRLFASKTLAAASLLCLLVLGDEVLRYLVQLPNSTSFAGSTFRPQWALASAVSGVMMALIFLGYSLFLSVFRRFGLLLGLVALASLEWYVHQRPDLRRLSPLDLHRMEFDGARALVPYQALLTHAFVALSLASVAGFVWLGDTQRWTSILARWVSASSMKWLFGLCVVAALGALGWAAVEHQQREIGSFGTVQELESPEAKLQSARYEFRYPAVLRGRVESMARAADPHHDRIARELGASDTRARVVVNLLRSSPTHAGSATWDTIRMDVASAADERGLLRTLAHETVHVLALRASDRRTASHHESLRFFDEGLAEQLSLELVPDEAYVAARGVEAALAVTRLRLDFDDLVSFPRFKARFGERAIYSPALFWIRALHTACGSDAPRRALHSLARSDTPRQASGIALWQHVLQAIGCDLSRVNAVWGESLQLQARELQTELARIPTLRGGAATNDEELVLNATLEGEPLESATYTAFLRSVTANLGLVGEGEQLSSAQGELLPDRRVKFSIWEMYEPGDTLEYQLAITWYRNGTLVQHAGEWQKTFVPKH